MLSQMDLKTKNKSDQGGHIDTATFQNKEVRIMFKYDVNMLQSNYKVKSTGLVSILVLKHIPKPYYLVLKKYL